jgi:hypothetical protein
VVNTRLHHGTSSKPFRISQCVRSSVVKSSTNKMCRLFYWPPYSQALSSDELPQFVFGCQVCLYVVSCSFISHHIHRPLLRRTATIRFLVSGLSVCSSLIILHRNNQAHRDENYTHQCVVLLHWLSHHHRDSQALELLQVDLSSLMSDLYCSSLS